MTTSFALGLAAALGAALVYGVGAIVQARAVRGLHADIAALGSFLRTAAGAPLIWLTVGMYLVGFVLHAVSIELLPLYLSQAGIALSLPVTAVCAGWLDQRLTARAWAALLMVVVGIGLMSAGAGQSGAHARPETWFTVTVAVAALVLAVVALLGLVTSPGWLGAFAGLAYAGCALAVRSVAWPLDGPATAAALAVAAYGGLGFWLYSGGLSRGHVSVSTASMVVGETAGPAVLGVLFLGDQVRDGWGLVVALGLLLAVAGAVDVGRSPRLSADIDEAAEAAHE